MTHLKRPGGPPFTPSWGLLSPRWGRVLGGLPLRDEERDSRGMREKDWDLVLRDEVGRPELPSEGKNKKT